MVILLFTITACQVVETPAPASPSPVPATVVLPLSTPTKTPQPTPTRTVRQAMQPYTIDGLRSHDYEDGPIILEAELLDGEHFTRYLISYPSDGIRITGILQIPKTGSPPYPVIVMNHGFFSRYVYYSGDGTDRAAEFLNRRGYLTISPDYRSWGKSDLAESLFYSGLAIDVINLINGIDSIPQADAGHIGMWGHSMGGGVTMKVLAVDSRVKAAVLYSSVSADFADIIERWGPGCYGDVLAGEQVIGCNSSDVLPESLPPDLVSAYFEAAKDPEIIQLVSPIYYFDRFSAPVQVVYGTADGKTSAGTPPEWSKKIYQSMKEAGVDAYLYAHQGEGHSFKADEWFAFMERAAQFFDRYVRP